MIGIWKGRDTAINWASHVGTLSETIIRINGMFVQSKILLQAHLINVVSRAAFDMPQSVSIPSHAHQARYQQLSISDCMIVGFLQPKHCHGNPI